MAFTRTGGSWIHEYAALSTDTKYTKATHPNIDVPNGSACIEIDTDDIYLYDKDNDQWCLFSSGGGGGGSGGTTNYNQLSNKPKINSVELSGNKTLENLGIAASEDLTDLSNAISVLEPSASSSDVGKFLKAKTVSGGKVTEYEFGSGGGGGGGSTAEDISYDETATYSDGTVGGAIQAIDLEINGNAETITLSGENLLCQNALDTNGKDQTTTTYFTKRLRTSSFYPVTPETTGTLSATFDSGLDLYFAVSFYTSANYSANRVDSTDWIKYSTSQTFSIPAGANYIRMTFKNGNAGSAAISYKSFTAMSITDGTHTYNLKFDHPETNLQYAGLNEDGTAASNATAVRVITDGFIPIGEEESIIIQAPSGFQVAPSFYSVNDPTAERIGTVAFADCIETTTPSDTQYMRVLVRASGNGAFSNGKVTAVTIASGVAGIKDQIEALEGKTANGKVIGTDFLARAVNTQEIGTLTYLQAFCKYGGKYYSTNGTNVGRQAESFVSETTVSLPVGHGNAMQLGSGSIAYVSGWDDQKIYAVDLSTLTISDTITLPTTGYTTCVVDDQNEIAYIFQRDSTPSTEARYNFIVYDLDNQQVISTRVINSFAAMQAADFYDGKIAILWGLGTNVAPSGMAIYNTAGDILCRFDLDIFASTEPEGIFIERDSGSILVSDVSKKVYRITDIHS